MLRRRNSCDMTMETDSPRFRRYTAAQRRDMLIAAGLACLARGGITGFTVDKICAEANASRGLITHHFKSKEGLLRAVYAAAYDRMLGAAAPGRVVDADLVEMIEALLSDELTDRDTLRAWLALWGEVANSPALRDEHRRYYDHYHDRVIVGIRRAAAGRKLAIAEGALAIMFISLIDGLWLQRCIDPERLSSQDVRDACYNLLEPYLGPIRPQQG
ncbi:TetR/AcrR family transcriptional regulator [Abyssibius alkaniclasticus]|uniref:TetR/AcrR family transcriptional regulator n=1 Tax=Abyssibius alkaniclasticus TaxID=2881234 RepID=UPI0040583CE2